MHLRYLLFSFLFSACAKNNGHDDQAPFAHADGSDCYQYASHGDTITLRLNVKGTLATGELRYNFLEKDDNYGQLIGTIEGNTLMAEYTFRSEGIESIREVAFMRHGNEWVEAVGARAEKDGKMVFTDKTTWTFDHGINLKPSPCHKNFE